MPPWTRAIALAAALAACGPTPPDVTTSTKFLQYHHWSDEQPCDEALAHLDTLVEFVAGRFGLTPQPIDYFKWRTSELDELRSGCVNSAPACARGTRADTTGWSHDHEVIHTIFDPLGFPPQLFVEGVAVVYGCTPAAYLGAPIDPAFDLEPLMSSAQWNSEYATNGSANYQAAGSFVRFLIDRFGEAAFASFYAHAAHGADVDGFERAFGVSFHDAVAAWHAAGPGRAGAFCILQQDLCQGPADLVQTGFESVQKRLSCVGTTVSIEALGGEPIALGVTSTVDPATVSVRPCAPASPYPGDIVYPSELTTAIGASSQGLMTPGEQLELRLFGAPARMLFSAHAAQAGDVFFDGDPEADPFGAPVHAGAFRVSPLPQRDQLFSQVLPVGASAWATHVTAPNALIPPDGGVLRLHSDQPVTFRGGAFGGLRSAPCVSGVDAGCGFFPTQWTDLDLTIPPAPVGGWFAVEVWSAH